MFDKTLLAVECPNCAEYTEKSLAQLQRAASISCCRCGALIDLTRDAVHAEIRGAIRRLRNSAARMRRFSAQVTARGSRFRATR